jgi:hypothetical protein
LAFLKELVRLVRISLVVYVKHSPIDEVSDIDRTNPRISAKQVERAESLSQGVQLDMLMAIHRAANLLGFNLEIADCAAEGDYTSRPVRMVISG